MAVPFEPAAALPDGRTAVEASAGTGKTFTIAAIVARLVAEEGVAIEQILVVTFTRAATAELRDRVRTRLVETHRALSTGRGAEGDEHLAWFLSAPAEAREVHRRRLAEAVTRFDRAQIFTIHGFAQRLLAQLGFRARIAPDAEPGSIDEFLLAEVSSDLVVGRFAHQPGELPVLSAREAANIGRVVAGVPDGTIVPAVSDVEGVPRSRVEMAHAVLEELRRRMRVAGTVSYDDGLVEVRDALTDPVVGLDARAMLRRRYAVALVDECQDTDPVQWQVIRAAFDDARLVVIGDPKQSIYSFRGADVESYLAAVGAAHHHRTLDTNWRSDGPLVAALDTLFRGATFGDERIGYRTVGPAPGREEAGIRGVRAACSLRVISDDYPAPRRSGGWFQVLPLREEIAADAAAEVVRLLGSGVTLAAAGGSRELRARDVAVLCRTGRQVEMVRDELDARGVPSVAARTGGVFVSEAAEEWRRFLYAVERPDRSRFVRLAATTVLVGAWTPGSGGMPEDQVLELQMECRRWQAVLQDQGVPALLADLDRQTQVSARVLARPDGERLITDLVHIAEEMHAAWRRGRIASLVGWLEGAMADARRKEKDSVEEAESRQRRLETDADAVRVLTVHGAKGLEFPVVLVPYGWDPPGGEPSIPVFHDDAEPGPDGARPRLIDVGGKGSPGHREHVAMARAEDAAEEGRLLYVALTRARNHLVVWWVPNAKPAAGSKLGELITGRGLETLAGEGIDVRTVERPADRELLRATRRVTGRLDRAVFGRALDHAWRRASFSSLSPEHPLTPAGGHADSELHLDEAGVDGDEAETVPAAGSTSPDESGPELPMAELPRGARFGTLVHDILERVDFGAEDLEDQVRRQVAEAVSGSSWDFDAEALVAGLVGAIGTPLGPSDDDLRLADLGRTDLGYRVLDELRFELPVRTASAAVTLGDMASVMLDHLDPAHPFARYAAGLGREDPDPFRGFLTGAIDLTAMVPGPDGPSFLVFDYKSNVLPMLRSTPAAEDYGPAPLHEAMTGGNYVLQATIYQVALHRYLQWKLPDYRPSVHLGGSTYLFLRGMLGPDTPVVDGERCGVVRWRPPAEMIVELSRLLAEAGR